MIMKMVNSAALMLISPESKAFAAIMLQHQLIPLGVEKVGRL